jgi:hypothetical protein
MSSPKVIIPHFHIFGVYYYYALNYRIIFLGCVHKIFPKNDLEGFLCYPNIGNNG